MNMESPPAPGRKAYYAEADSWSRDVHGALRQSRRIAWIVAGGACAVAVLEAVALAALAPLKTVIPYTITVDRQTGFVETVRGLKPGPLAQDVAVTDAFLAQYVLARETFDAADLQANYRKVAQWTTGRARDDYIRAMSASNPQSPVKLNPPSAIVQTTVKSISLLTRNSALVRFQTQRQDVGGAGDIRPYAAVIAFKYTGAPMRMEDRLTNPLGFEVTSYRRDAETTAPIPAPAPLAGAVPGQTMNPAQIPNPALAPAAVTP